MRYRSGEENLMVVLFDHVVAFVNKLSNDGTPLQRTVLIQVGNIADYHVGQRVESDRIAPINKSPDVFITIGQLE
jgi:hypothetical protein